MTRSINDTEWMTTKYVPVEELKRTLADISEDHEERLNTLRYLAKAVKNEELDLTELVDLGFLLRECETFLDEMRKDFKAHKEMIGKVTCYQLSLEDETKHQGTLAIGSAKITHYSNIPHPSKEPERFMEVCKFFGVNVDPCALESVRLHWPTVRDKITEAMENGEELPQGLSDVKTDLGMTYRRLNK